MKACPRIHRVFAEAGSPHPFKGWEHVTCLNRNANRHDVYLMLTMSNKVHSVKGKTVIRRFQHRLLPYGDLVDVLKTDGSAFIEDSTDEPLKRGTMWRSAKRLSELLGKKVKAERVIVRTEGQPEGLEGYLFSVED